MCSPGEAGGRKGIFPLSFVEIIREPGRSLILGFFFDATRAGKLNVSEVSKIAQFDIWTQ